MSKGQLTLFDIKPNYTEYQKRKWTTKYKEYCNEIYEERGSYSGEYCCGYHWCCDKCECKLCNGCADCVHTIKQIAKEYGIAIDYNDYDFEKIERNIKEVYEQAK